MSDITIPGVLAKSEPIVSAIYARLIERITPFGPFEVEEKKTSIHLARGTAFGGITPRKAAIILTVRLAHGFKDGAGTKATLATSERASKNRWHHDFRLEAPADVDRGLVALLKEAYALSA